MDSFHQPHASSSPILSSSLIPRTKNTFEDKWAELGSILKETWSRQDVFSFTKIKFSDIVDALTHAVPDEHHLWTSPSLAPFIRLTSWEHVRGETGFYELAATLTSPTTVFAFECPHEVPKTYMYGHHELVSIPSVVTANTFVFLLQRISSQPTTTSHTPCVTRKKRLAPSDISPVTAVDPSTSDADLSATVTVTSTHMTEPVASIPVTERQRMVPVGSGSTVISSSSTPSSTSAEFTFDLHEIMLKWKSENKRPTVEKICETEHIVQRDVKRWLESKGLTWTKMLIQYGFRETKN